MQSWSAHCLLVTVLLATGLGCGCEGSTPDAMVEAVEERLAGTWLREYHEDATRVRRILVLERDGSFQERTKVLQPGAAAVQYSHQGKWLFDGTNLKRRYTLVDGHLPAAPMVPFATFQLEFPTRHEFVGTDNVRRRQVRYHRVAAGTLP